MNTRPDAAAIQSRIAAGMTQRKLEKYNQEQTRRAARVELIRRQLITFVKALNPDYLADPFHIRIANQLTEFIVACERGENPRMMLWCPPQHGKSWLASRYLPAYILGRNPNYRVAAVSYSQDLASRFGSEVRDVLQDPLFQTVFPDTILDHRVDRVNEQRTTSGGGYRAVGMGGSLSGFPTDVLIIDDPLKDWEQADSQTEREKQKMWYDSVGEARLADGGGVLIIQTRWHEDDLSGWLLDRDEKVATQYKQNWNVVRFKAISTEPEEFRSEGKPLAPSLKSLEFLQRKRASSSPRVWNALYQQTPTAEDGDVFEEVYLREANVVEAFPENVRGTTVIGVDTAISEAARADWTVIAPVTFTESLAYVRPLDRFKSNTGHVDRILYAAEMYDAQYLVIERTDATRALMPTLQAEMARRGKYYKILFPPPQGTDKRVRATPLQDELFRGRIRFTDQQQFREHILPEFLKFPSGKHDDIVDAIAWVFRMLPEIPAISFTTSPPEPKEPPAHVARKREIDEKSYQKPNEIRNHAAVVKRGTRGRKCRFRRHL